MGSLFSAPSLPAPTPAAPPPKVTDPNVEAARRGEIKAAQQARGRAATAFGGLKAQPVLGGGASIGRKALLGT